MTERAVAARDFRRLIDRPHPTAVIIPVLDRPHRVTPLLESLAAATPEPWRAVFVVDGDDDDELAAVLDAEAAGFPILHVPVLPGTCYGAKINAGVLASSEPVLFQAADDLKFHPEWLTRAQSRLSDRVHVVGTNDLYNQRVVHGKHSTHSLFTRQYVMERGTIDQPGLAMHPGYPHAYVDDEFVQTARHRRAFKMARDAIVEHLHPFAKKAPEDWVYLKGRALDDAGRAVYEERRHLWNRHFAGL